MSIPANALQIVKSLHAAYEARSGYPTIYNIARENQWREWCTWGGWTWTEADLALVILYLRRKINKGDRNEGALKFGNLIGQPDKFEEDLNLAREESKKPAFGGRRRASSARSHSVSTVAEEDAPQDAATAAEYWRRQFGRQVSSPTPPPP